MTIVATDTRSELEHFIAQRFRAAYGAQVRHYCRHLLGIRDGDGEWQVAAGYTPATAGMLYLEHYLDRPVELVLSGALGERVARSRIVEVGNFASGTKGFGARFLPMLRRHLLDLGFVWAVFTATREVRGILQRLAYDARALAPAAPACLPDGGAGWGTYYAHDPSVMGGRI